MELLALVTTDWLRQRTGRIGFTPSSMPTKFMPGCRTPIAQPNNEAGHIPGAVFMDLSELTRQQQSGRKYASRAAEKFAQAGCNRSVGRRPARVRCFTMTAPASKPHARVVDADHFWRA